MKELVDPEPLQVKHQESADTKENSSERLDGLFHAQKALTDWVCSINKKLRLYRGHLSTLMDVLSLTSAGS